MSVEIKKKKIILFLVISVLMNSGINASEVKINADNFQT